MPIRIKVGIEGYDLDAYMWSHEAWALKWIKENKKTVVEGTTATLELAAGLLSKFIQDGTSHYAKFGIRKLSSWIHACNLMCEQFNDADEDDIPFVMYATW